MKATAQPWRYSQPQPAYPAGLGTAWSGMAHRDSPKTSWIWAASRRNARADRAIWDQASLHRNTESDKRSEAECRRAAGERRKHNDFFRSAEPEQTSPADHPRSSP